MAPNLKFNTLFSIPPRNQAKQKMMDTAERTASCYQAAHAGTQQDRQETGSDDGQKAVGQTVVYPPFLCNGGFPCVIFQKNYANKNQKHGK